MDRKEVYSKCLEALEKSSFLLLEACTGYGKSKMSIDLVNNLVDTKLKEKKEVSMLLLVAKRVHKQTWKDEFKKWGGIKVDNLTVECYESFKKYQYKDFDIIVCDEVHHLNSERRLDILSTVYCDYFIGLSATIPKKLKQCFQYEYHAETVVCNITEAINSNILPDPEIILFPIELDRINPTETIEVNPKAKGKTHYGKYEELWKYRKMKVHAFISCTERQKVNEYNAQILREKNLYTRNRQEFFKNRWLHDCGERLKYLAILKNDFVKAILNKLDKERTITFCKTIEQAEKLGKYSIHSKNPDSDKVYDDFNKKKINHITSVNVLNEGANLVDCKYAIFANYSGSELIGVQRIGRSMRHKSPVIILPYYEATREEEIVNTMIGDFNKECIHRVHSLDELDEFIQ